MGPHCKSECFWEERIPITTRNWSLAIQQIDSKHVQYQNVAAHVLHITLRLLEKYCPYLQNISLLFWGIGDTSLAVMNFFL